MRPNRSEPGRFARVRNTGWAVVLCAALGCSDGASDIGDGAVSTGDAGAGALDGGAFDDARPLEPSCSFGPLRVSVRVSHDRRAGDGGGSDANVEATATASSAPNVFTFADGSRLRIFVQGDAPAPVIASGTAVSVVARQEQGGDLVVIKAANGELLFAGWASAIEQPVIEGLDLSVDDDRCAPLAPGPGVPVSPCGPVRTRTLSFASDSGVLRIAAGKSDDFGPYRIVNGVTFTYEPLNCTDIPTIWGSGAIYRR